MKNSTHSPRGFTLLELLIVISIIAILSAALFPVFGYMRKRAQMMQARKTMDTLDMAITDYRKDFNAFPPDNSGGVSGNNGSQMIALYLTRAFVPDTKVSEMHYGPYLKVQESQLVDVNGKMTKDSMERLFLSPLGGQYQYVILKDTINGLEREVGYVLVDPGFDKDYGGTLDPKNGFNPGNIKAANDNIFDAQTAALMKLQGIGN
ncbi:MAG: type II secretion system protein [Planctomycetota bacterium]